MRKRFLIPLLAVLPLPSSINADATNDYFLKLNQSVKLFSKGKFSEMKNICEEIIEISPEVPNGYVCKGIALGFTSKNKRKSREALTNLTKAIEINPEYYEAYFFRGLLQFQMQRERNSKIDRTACSDIKKAYLNNHPLALKYVEEKKSFLRRDRCTGFF